MTAGSTIAAFSDSVQARRRDVGIHRALGANPIQVGKMVGADALRIAIPAGIGGVTLAILVLVCLSWVGALTVFGVQLAPSFPVGTLGLITVGGVVLALFSALVVTIRFAVVDPSRLFGGSR
nr:ABC transporter permease [Halomarina rubra]